MSSIPPLMRYKTPVGVYEVNDNLEVWFNEEGEQPTMIFNGTDIETVKSEVAKAIDHRRQVALAQLTAKSNEIKGMSSDINVYRIIK